MTIRGWEEEGTKMTILIYGAQLGNKNKLDAGRRWSQASLRWSKISKSCLEEMSQMSLTGWWKGGRQTRGGPCIPSRQVSRSEGETCKQHSRCGIWKAKSVLPKHKAHRMEGRNIFPKTTQDIWPQGARKFQIRNVSENTRDYVTNIWVVRAQYVPVPTCPSISY